MPKIKLILLIMLLNTGCSVFFNVKKVKSNELETVMGVVTNENVKKWNLSKSNFFISKAEIEVRRNKKKEKLLGSLKFNNPDKYLISLKTISGIELARLLITNDTLLVNDRVNKKQYFGSPKFLKKLLGITSDFLPLVFGDLIIENISDSIFFKCIDGKIDFSGYKKGIKVNYVFNCKRWKSTLAVIDNSLNQTEIEIIYKEFLMGKDFVIPREIEIYDLPKKVTVKIRINKVESPWEGNLEFIPGNGYEKLPLK